MAVMRTMMRDLVTTMIPQKGTQVSCDPSFHCVKSTSFLNEYLNMFSLLFYKIPVKWSQICFGLEII